MDREELIECGIDYEQGIKRFMGSDELFEKFLLKFRDDKSYSGLKKALEENDCDAAFKEAHTLKGVAGNLSMVKLMEMVSELTEALRAGDLDKGKHLTSDLDKQYMCTMQLLDRL